MKKTSLIIAIALFLLIGFTGAYIGNGVAVLTIPTSTTATTNITYSISRITVKTQYSEEWDGVDSLGNNIMIIGNWSGADADSARLSPMWRVTSLCVKYNWSFTTAQKQAFINSSGLK